MLLTLVGIVTDVNVVQYAKPAYPILVYEDGITTDDDCNDEQPKYNAYDVTDDGIAVDGTCVPRNTSLPIVVTLVGIVIDASDVHSLKAPVLIRVTVVGIVTDISDVHE